MPTPNDQGPELKNPPGGSQEGGNVFGSRLETSDVRRLKTFGAFEEIELDGFAFVQRAISVLLDRREMDEYVLARGALDKSVTLCSVKPLHSSLLSHRETPLPFREEFIPSPAAEASGSFPTAPPQADRREQVALLRRENCQTQTKSPKFDTARKGNAVPRSAAPDRGANFYRSTQERQPTCRTITAGVAAVVENNMQVVFSWQAKKFAQASQAHELAPSQRARTVTSGQSQA
jgi:hypothetical protein